MGNKGSSPVPSDPPAGGLWQRNPSNFISKTSVTGQRYKSWGCFVVSILDTNLRYTHKKSVERVSQPTERSGRTHLSIENVPTLADMEYADTKGVLTTNQAKSGMFT